MKEFNCLDPNQEILGKFFLEASAGTGKTFALCHIFLRLVLETEIDVREILVVTFTRAATRELRQRIRELLEQHRDDSKRVNEALYYFDELQIFTIHGFCHRMLTNFGFDAGILLSDSEEMDHRQLIRQEVEDFFRSSVINHGFHWKQVADVMRSEKGSIAACVERLVSLLEKRETIAPIQCWDELTSEMPVPAGFTEENLEEIALLYKGLLDRSRRLHEKYSGQVSQLSSGLSILEIDEPFFLLIRDDNLKKGAKRPDLPWVDQLEKMAELYQMARDPERIKLRMANELRPIVAKALRRESVFLPDHLLVAMCSALQKPSFFKQVSSCYRAAVIDEFQDTDDRQWDIFSKLFMERDVDAFYLVGDPKQSIYRFRGADVGVYLKARSQFDEGQIWTLSTNFRSVGNLIARLNSLMGCESAGSWLDTIEYFPVSAQGEEKDIGDGKEAVHFALCEAKRGRSARWPTPEMEAEVIFPYIATEIERLRKNHGFHYGDFAVLIKDRFQAQRLKLYFDNLQLPSKTRSLEHIANTEMYSVLGLLLRFFYNPHDESVIRQLLLSTLCEVRAAELDEDWKNERLAFYSLREIFENSGFAQSVAQLFKTKLNKKTVLERLAGLPNLEFYADFMQLVELLLDRSSTQGSSVEDLLTLMDIMKKETLEEQPALKRRGMGEEDQVTIMTTHMSKGLEFEVVFALGIATRSSVKEKVVSYQGELTLMEGEARADHAKNRDAEKMREFYVALTRAKQRVYVPLCMETGVVGISPAEMFSSRLVETYSKDSLTSQLQSLQISVDEMQEQKVAPVEKENETVENMSELEVILPLVSHKKVYSFSALAHGLEQVNKVEDVCDGLPSSSEIGIFFHAILEKVVDRWLYRDKKLIESFVKTEVKHAGLGLWEDEICAMVQAAFNVKMGDFFLKDVPPTSMLCEMEFLYEQNESSIMKGFIDLIVMHESQVFVIDWKTNFLGNKRENYLPENLEKTVLEHAYNMQSAIYGEAIKKYLNLIEKSAYEGHCGGAYYIFLRGLKWDGCGVYHMESNKAGGEIIDVRIGEGSI